MTKHECATTTDRNGVEYEPPCEVCIELAAAIKLMEKDTTSHNVVWIDGDGVIWQSDGKAVTRIPTSDLT